MLTIHLDVLIVGGGGTGLWLLDELIANRFSAILLENNALGSFQTAGSQGIIHGGLKYALGGLPSRASLAIRDMPATWRECLEGKRQPNLQEVAVRSDYCYLWLPSTSVQKLAPIVPLYFSILKRLLNVSPEKVPRNAQPGVLKQCPGEVYRLPEQVVDPVSLVSLLARRNMKHILKADINSCVDIRKGESNIVESITLANPISGEKMEFVPRFLVLSAGKSNSEIRTRLDLPDSKMQLRPLNMILLRGNLPRLYGHCIGFRKPRMTITTIGIDGGLNVWQVGGQISEDGVHMSRDDLLEHARNELRLALPDIDLKGTEFTTYRIDRAEGQGSHGRRPDGPVLFVEGNVITAWPTKLAFFPRIATIIASKISGKTDVRLMETDVFSDWPRPSVAKPPWEESRDWEPVIKE